MKPFAICGVVALAFVAVIATINCATQAPPMARCMRSEALGAFSYSANLGALALAAYVGFHSGRRTRRVWLGWAVAISLTILLSGLLHKFGIHMPTSSYDE